MTALYLLHNVFIELTSIKILKISAVLFFIHFPAKFGCIE